MDISRLCKKFLAMEKSYDLHESYDTDDIPLWLLLRFQVWWTLIVVHKLNLQRSTMDPTAGGTLGKLKIVANLLQGAMGTRLRGLKPSYDFLFLSAGRHQFIDGKYYDTCCDFLIEALADRRSLSIIPTGGRHYYKPLAGQDYYYLDETNLMAAIKQQLGGNDPKVLKSIREILEIITETFEFEIDVDRQAVQLYTDRVFNFQQYRKFYRRKLRQLKPRLVFEVCHYSAKSMGLNVAAAEAGIDVVELQHGTMSAHHVGYQYPNLEANVRHPALPTHIFLFGEYWKQFCQMPIPESNKMVCGFPYMEWLKSRAQQAEKSGKQILVISQRLIGQQLAKFVVELAGLLSDDYRIVYKLHPAEYDDLDTHFSELAALSNVQIPGKDSKKSLYDYFAESDFQIGVFSTAVYEGLAFNLPTFIAALPGYETLSHLIEHQYVQLAQTPAELAEALKEPASTDMTSIVGDIWAPNALATMKAATEGLLEDA